MSTSRSWRCRRTRHSSTEGRATPRPGKAPIARRRRREAADARLRLTTDVPPCGTPRALPDQRTRSRARGRWNGRLHMSHFFSRAITAVALLGSLGACASREPGLAVEPDPSAALAVEVRNEAFSDIVVYSVSAGTRWRLGLVPGNRTVTLEIPRHLLPAAGPLELLA